MTRKIKVRACASSNISYDRTEYQELPEEWDGLDEVEQSKYLDQVAADFIWEDIESYAEVVDAEDDE